MQKYNRLIGFSIVLLFLIGFWIIIGFLSLSTTKSMSSNKQLLPEEIDLVMTVNTQELIQTFLFDLFFRADLDEKSVQVFTLEDNAEIKRSGINLNSEVIVFYDNFNSSSAKGVLVNISNEGDFKRYPIDEKNTIRRSNSSHGVIIFLNDKVSPEAIEYYTNLANSILDRKIKELQTPDRKGVINIDYTGDELTYLKNLNLDLNLKDQTVFIDGKAKINQKSTRWIQKTNTTVKPAQEKYFQIKTGEIPNDAMKYLESTFTQLGIRVPSVSSQQLLLYGVTIDNIDGSTAVLPNLDWILRFNEPFQIDTVLMNLKPNYKSLTDFSNKTISIGSVKYHYTQISENEIYIGVNAKPDFVTTEFQPFHSISGDPSAILEIEGQGFVANFIKLLPPVKLSKQFLEGITYFEIRTEEIDDNLFIKGEIRVNEGKLITVEIAKIILLL